MDQDSHSDAAAACSDLARRFCFAADEGDPDAVASLFSVQDVFEREGLTVRGRESILAMVRTRAPDLVTRHHLTTSRIETSGPDAASGRHYCIVYASGGEHDPTRPMVREYRDTYVREDGQWVIARRHVITPFP